MKSTQGQIDKRALIKRHALFQGLEDEVIDRIVSLGVTERLKIGETLFMKGDKGDALYGVLSGRVRIYASAPSGKEVTLNAMEPGDMFGEIALLDGNPRTAGAVAETDTDLVAIHRRDFLAYLEHEPRLAMHCIRLLCDRVRRTSELVEDAAFLSLPARLAKRLLVLADLYGKDDSAGRRIGLQLSQREIAQMMSTTRESVNKHLQAWKREDWIDLARGSVVIRDADALQGVIDSGLDGDF